MIKVFGTVSLRNVSVIMNMSMFSVLMSVARSVLALALVELIFLREKTLSTPIVGRRVLNLCCGEFVLWLVGWLSVSSDGVLASHIWGGHVP